MGIVGPEVIVGRLLAVQAQDLRSTALGLHARGGSSDAAALHRALAQERSVVRLWALRGTLHLVAAQDAGWLLGLLAPALEPDSQAQVSTVHRATVRLLPAWDELLLGWRDRAPILPPGHAKKVQRGGGILRPTVLHGGTIVATWRPERAPGRITITVEPFTAPLDATVTASLTAAVRETATFEGRHPTLELSDSPR